MEEKKDLKPIWIYLIFNILCPMVLSIIIGFFGAFILALSGISEDAIMDKINLILTENFSYLLSLISLIIMIIVIVIIYRKNIIDGFKKLKMKDYIRILIYTIVFVIINFIGSSVLEKFNVATENQNTIISLLGSYPIMTSIYVVLGPITEEFLFRYSIGTIIKNKTAYIIVSSVLFGIIHGIGIATLLYIVLGVLLALIYLKNDKNIVTSCMVHIINNTVSLISVFL